MKKSYKIMAFSAFIFTTSNIFPVNALALERTEKNIPITDVVADVKNKYSEYSLGPEGLRDAIVKTGSNTLVMDLYALTIIKQANINFEGVKVVEESLKQKVINHQDIARINAKKWLNVIKPQLIITNQNIINYNTKFQNYSNTLVEAIDNKDKETLSKGLTRLSASITENKVKVEKLVNDLKKYRNKMTEDTQNFKGNAFKISSILSSQDAGIPLLQEKMTTYNMAANKLNMIIIGSAIGTALGPIAIVGGVYLVATGGGAPLGLVLIAGGTAALGGGITGVVLAKRELDNAHMEIQKLAGNITDVQLQVANLTNIKNQTEYLTSTIDIAINSLQNISSQWQRMGSKYSSLIQNIQSINPEELAFIKEDINIAKASWNDIKGYAEKIYAEEIKIVDNEPESIE
ncbi:non-hemolytic enterotoxin lytic component L1 [Bacillus cereus VD196]|uniref:Non-hemolytic enterotoxin lytic component L1 n=2 Tax=Bacillus cereus TaxID=1396 RepID=A0A9W5V5U8_BACCE|nr:hypothetical protein IKG_05937 [Bacillus cereus VD200]EOO60515.1 non-hemolytic enterotoxin lytic component L1 [Bacillus cereus VD196]